MTERPYHAIGDVLGLLREEFPEITISKIRFLESRGLLVPERTPSGFRRFTDADVDRLRWILRQQRENFLPLKVIKGRLEGDPGDPEPEPPAQLFDVDPARGREPALVGAELASADRDPEPAAFPRRHGGGGGDRLPPAGSASEPPFAPPVAPVSAPPAEARIRQIRPLPSQADDLAADDGLAHTPDPVRSQAGEPASSRRRARVAAPPEDDGAGEPEGEHEPRSSRRRAAVASDPPIRPLEAQVGQAVGMASGENVGEGGTEASGRAAPPKKPRQSRSKRAVVVDTGASLTAPELASASALQPEDIDELESYGLLKSRIVGGVRCYDEEALVTARLAAKFAKHGIEARHLRIFKHAADRQLGLYEQVVTPLLRQRNPESRAKAAADLEELSGLGATFQKALLIAMLRDLTG